MAEVDSSQREAARLTALRREIHKYPELGFHEERTAALIATELRRLGLDVHEGIGGTGVVGVLKVGTSSASIGLRADMDALAIEERTGLAYASERPGIFHGCGHDGHVAMLLGAASRLCAERRFDGTVNFIFQPAEEGLGGARAMIADGLFERFPCDTVFAVHNWPELPSGVLATRSGAIMAAADRFEITLKGVGGHAAMPHRTPDVILAASELVSLLNSIVARIVPPTEIAVLSVTTFNAGTAHNVLPAEARLGGTVRTFDPAVQDLIEQALRRYVAGVSQAHGLTVEVVYDRYYPATINDEASVERALAAVNDICDARRSPSPSFTSEDFAFMLQACPGAYLWLGQGRDRVSPALHNPSYDFNDDILPIGVDVHCALVDHYIGCKPSDAPNPSPSRC